MGYDGSTLRIQTIVIGGGQAGLSVGYHLSRLDQPFLILDAAKRTGDAWRNRWDSLRLFTPSRFNGLDGMPFPGNPDVFPTKDAMADYLEAYARRFRLPIRSGVTVERLSRRGPTFRLETTDGVMEAENVVVAMSGYQRPRIPDVAEDIDPAIHQLHSAEYRGPDDLRPGPVLLAGAGNSGSEIAMELASRHPVWMSGRKVGQLPFRTDGPAGRLFLVRLVLRGLFHRVLTVDNALGLKVRRQVLHKGGPLIRVKEKDLRRAGVERVGKVVGTERGWPVVEGGRMLEPRNIVWCTGFDPGFDWIDLPVLEDGYPRHRSGIVPGEPGLFFAGLHFLHALSSAMVHGVGRDAARVARAVARRSAPAGVSTEGYAAPADSKATLVRTSRTSSSM